MVVALGGHKQNGRIWLSVNGEVKQDSDLSLMRLSVPETINILSQYYKLKVGDIILFISAIHALTVLVCYCYWPPSSGGAPGPVEPANRRSPLGRVTSRPLARLEPSLAW